MIFRNIQEKGNGVTDSSTILTKMAVIWMRRFSQFFANRSHIEHSARILGNCKYWIKNLVLVIVRI